MVFADVSGAGWDPADVALSLEMTAKAADPSAVDVVPEMHAPCLFGDGYGRLLRPALAVPDFADSIAGAAYHELRGCGHTPFFKARRLCRRGVSLSVRRE